MAARFVTVYGPAQPGTTTAVLATVPANMKWTLKSIRMANTTGVAATITIGIGGTAAADQIVPTQEVPPNDVLSDPDPVTLDAAETIDGLQGTANAVTVTITVVEEDV